MIDREKVINQLLKKKKKELLHSQSHKDFNDKMLLPYRLVIDLQFKPSTITAQC